MQRAVSENFGDLGERCTVTDHPGRETVAKQVRGTAAERAANPSASHGSPHDVTHRGRACKTHARSDRAEKHLARGAGAAITLKVQCQGLADIRWQRQEVQGPTLPAHKEGPGPPTDITQFEGNYLPSTQAKSRKEKQNRMIAAPC